MTRKSSFFWLELIHGILLIVLAVLTFANPGAALGGLIFVYGILAIVMGIADIALYIRLERRTGFGPVTSLVMGILGIIAGVLILINPGAGAWVLSLLFPIWFIAHSISRLANLGYTKAVGGTAPFVISLILGILGLLLGILLIFNPTASALAVAYTIGIYFALMGVGSLVLAFSDLGSGRGSPQ